METDLLAVKNAITIDTRKSTCTAHVLYMYCTDITYNVYTNDAENIGTQQY